MKHLKIFSRISSLLAALLGAATLMLSPVANAHTIQICWEDVGPVTTFYAGSYHSPSEAPSPVGSIIIDGFAYPFSGWIAPNALPATAKCYTQAITPNYGTRQNPGYNSDGFANPGVVHFQTFTSAFPNASHTLDFSGVHQVVAPWGPYPSFEFGGGACADADFDGICNDVDACPLDFSNDADNDGICGNLDNCPLDSNSDQADANGNSQGDACEGDVCGNNLLTGSEQCDDGNIAGGDGCSALCTFEVVTPPVVVIDNTTPLVFANTYVSTGINSEANGNIVANTYVTSGAYTNVTGSIISGAAVTLGAYTTVGGNIQADAAVTTGASSIVGGTVQYGGAFTPGAGSSTGIATYTTTPSVTYSNQRVKDAQTVYNNMGPGTTIPATMPINVTLTSGVYNATSLTTTAGIILTLDAQGVDSDWVFNITDLLSFGANTQIIMINGTSNSSVTWNAGNFSAIGAGAKIVGTMLSHSYISTGAGSEVTGVSSCGGLFSATSYVSIGATSTIGSTGCTPVSLPQ